MCKRLKKKNHLVYNIYVHRNSWCFAIMYMNWRFSRSIEFVQHLLILVFSRCVYCFPVAVVNAVWILGISSQVFVRRDRLFLSHFPSIVNHLRVFGVFKTANKFPFKKLLSAWSANPCIDIGILCIRFDRNVFFFFCLRNTLRFSILET